MKGMALEVLFSNSVQLRWLLRLAALDVVGPVMMLLGDSFAAAIGSSAVGSSAVSSSAASTAAGGATAGEVDSAAPATAPTPMGEWVAGISAASWTCLPARRVFSSSPAAAAAASSLPIFHELTYGGRPLLDVFAGCVVHRHDHFLDGMEGGKVVQVSMADTAMKYRRLIFDDKKTKHIERRASSSWIVTLRRTEDVKHEARSARNTQGISKQISNSSLVIAAPARAPRSKTHDGSDRIETALDTQASLSGRDTRTIQCQ